MWKRLDENKLLNIGGSFASVKRAYGWGGRPWPLLTIAIYEGRGATDPSTINIGCSRKEHADDEWTKSDIPLQLLPDLIKMLNDYRPKPPWPGTG